MSHDDALDSLIATAKAHDLPPEGAEDQAWAAFAGGLGGGGGGGAEFPVGAEGAAAAGAKLGVVLKVVAALAVASAAAVGVARWSEPTPEPSASVEPSPASAPSPVEPRAPMPPPVVAAAAPPAVADPEPAQPVPAQAAAPSRETPVSPPPAAALSTLAQEARLVGSMWKALDRGDARRALALAQSHGARFEGGALDLEARAAALAARCVLRRPVDLHELESVKKSATASVAKRVSAACAKKP